MKYRQSVGVIIKNNKNQFLMFKRTNCEDACWQFVQGEIDGENTLEKALFRELKEETNIENVKVIKQLQFTTKYDFPEYAKRPDDIYIGQEHTWFLVEYLGDCSEIRFDTNPEEIEFCDYKWVEKENILDLVVAFKQPVYEKILNAI